jgi:hypothetical protein
LDNVYVDLINEVIKILENHVNTNGNSQNSKERRKIIRESINKFSGTMNYIQAIGVLNDWAKNDLLKPMVDEAINKKGLGSLEAINQQFPS